MLGEDGAEGRRKLPNFVKACASRSRSDGSRISVGTPHRRHVASYALRSISSAIGVAEYKRHPEQFAGRIGKVSGSLACLREFPILSGSAHRLSMRSTKSLCYSGVGDGGGGYFGRCLARQLESGLLDQELEFRLRLCVAGQQQIPSAGRRQMDIDHLDGGRRGMQTAP